jgi:hypothetical protein
MMTEDEFRDIWIAASSVVADRFYPKGESDDRGFFLRDQAVLFVEVAARLAEAGKLDGG